MIQNVKTNQKKIVNYKLGHFIILYLFFLLFYNCSKKEDVYLLYDDFSDCEYVETSKKNMYYGMCYKHNVILFKKNPKKKPYETKNIQDFELTHKEDFFKMNYRKLEDVNLFLIIEKNKKIKIIPVSIVEGYEIIS